MIQIMNLCGLLGCLWQEVLRESPLPNLLKYEEHQFLIIDLCKALASVQRYEEVSEIIDLSMRLASNALAHTWFISINRVLQLGTAIIESNLKVNLALRFRLQNKHQCLAQCLAFIYNNFRLCENTGGSIQYCSGMPSRQTLSLAASYYEKMLVMKEKDYPIPKYSNKYPERMKSKDFGSCDIRSAAVDLAGKLLKDYCTF